MSAATSDTMGGMSSRAPLFDILGQHRPEDEKERADLEVMRRYAGELEAPFSCYQARAHFTGSAVVAAPDGQHVCLVLHAKLGRWLQPGGHADPADGGSMQTTALREAREETGLAVQLHPAAGRPLDVDVHRIPERTGEPAHEHLDVRYLVVATNPGALAHDPGEALGAQWLSWEEALSRVDEPALRRLLKKARRACLGS